MRGLYFKYPREIADDQNQQEQQFLHDIEYCNNLSF